MMIGSLRIGTLQGLEYDPQVPNFFKTLKEFNVNSHAPHLTN